MRIGRFDLAQSSRDHQQAVRVFGHLPQASDKHWTLGGEGAHQIQEILALDNADVLKSRNRVVAQFQGPMFHSTEPALEAREVEWILLAGIHHQHRARCFELCASTFGQDRYGRRWHGICTKEPFQWGGDQIPAPESDHRLRCNFLKSILMVYSTHQGASHDSRALWQRVSATTGERQQVRGLRDSRTKARMWARLIV